MDTERGWSDQAKQHTIEKVHYFQYIMCTPFFFNLLIIGAKQKWETDTEVRFHLDLCDFIVL